MSLLLAATVILSIIDHTHAAPVGTLDDAAANQSIDTRDQNCLFPTTYLAMGDSFASGIGAGNYFNKGDEQDNKRCKRFSDSYPAQAVDLPALRSLPESAFNFVACSGEKLDGIDVRRKAVSRVKADVVTLSIGGNDFGFEEAVRNCIFGFTTAAAASCGPALNLAEQKLNNQATWDKYKLKVSDIQNNQMVQSTGNLDSSVLIITGYPKFFATPGFNGDPCSGFAFPIFPLTNGPNLSATNRKRINSAIASVNDQSKAKSFPQTPKPSSSSTSTLSTKATDSASQARGQPKMPSAPTMTISGSSPCKHSWTRRNSSPQP